MQVWRGLAEVPPAGDPSVVTIGVFDGVHRGHQALIGRAVALARESGRRAVAVTFDPHPAQVVGRGAPPPLLATLDRRLELLAGTGLDATLVVEFTPQFAALGPEEFFAEVLLARLHAAAVVAGENFRFGHRGTGDVGTLARLGAPAGVAVESFALQAGPGAAGWSSSAVRAALSAGDVAGAAAVLGRPHRLPGLVVPGDGRGRELGFPTLNLAPPGGLALPADGVYAGWVLADRRRWPAAVSVGTNPTFGGTERRVEAYLIDAEVALYGRRIAVDFVARLREMRAFPTVDALVAAMHADVAAARSALRDANLERPDSEPEAV